MAYDPRLGTVVLYGGDNANNTQTWDWTGSAWQQVGSGGPCNTSFNSMARDVGRSVVLFGGYGFCGFQNTTELWTGTTWIQLAEGVSPPARAFQVMAYDPRRRQVVMFGGATADGTKLNDTWVLH